MGVRFSPSDCAYAAILADNSSRIAITALSRSFSVCRVATVLCASSFSVLRRYSLRAQNMVSRQNRANNWQDRESEEVRSLRSIGTAEILFRPILREKKGS
jgi:hypothetical protein